MCYSKLYNLYDALNINGAVSEEVVDVPVRVYEVSNCCVSCNLRFFNTVR